MAAHVHNQFTSDCLFFCSSIIKFAEQCLDAEMRSSIFSPRLMEVHFFYLIPELGKFLTCFKFSDSNALREESYCSLVPLSYLLIGETYVGSHMVPCKMVFHLSYAR